MKKTIMLSGIALSIFIGACSNSTSTKENFVALDTIKLKAGEKFYQCPMHADITSDKESTCPKCGGMEVEKKVKQ